MGFTFIILIALLFVIQDASMCFGIGIDNKVQVITETAKSKTMVLKAAVGEEDLLGGKPMNMTEEPKAVMNGLCPQGCSKCIASVPYLCTCRTSINENTLTFILLQHFFFYSVHFLLHTLHLQTQAHKCTPL